MKRMYIVLAAILLVMLGTVGALSQILSSDQSPPTRQPFDRQKRRMELREEMHRRMRDKLINGIGPDHDLFKGMDEAFEDAFTDVAPTVTSNFKSEWTESSNGRVLVITPQSKDQKLNIDVNAKVITIKGESQQKTPTSTFMSSFTNSFPVPDDCDGTKVKMDQKDGNLLVFLPFKGAARPVPVPSKEERRPLPPTEGAVEI